MLTLGSRDFQAQPLNQEQEMNLNFECTKGNWNCFKLKAYKMQAKIKNVEVKLELKHCICLQNQKCYTRSKKILILKWWKWDHLAQSQPESQPLHPLRCILDQPWSYLVHPSPICHDLITQINLTPFLYIISHTH